MAVLMVEKLAVMKAACSAAMKVVSWAFHWVGNWAEKSAEWTVGCSAE